MFNKFKFTVLMACCDNQENLERSILGILNQNIRFQENIQLIFLNNNPNENIRMVLDYYSDTYPKNIFNITDYDKTVEELYNLGLNEVKGKYLTFIDANDYISTNSLNIVYNLFERQDETNIVKIPKTYLNAIIDIKNEKFKRIETVDLLVSPDRILTSIKSLFFRTKSIKNKFDSKLTTAAQLDFIYNILLDNNSYTIHNTPKYFVRQKYPQKTDSIHDKNYYNYRLDNFNKKLLDSSKNIHRYIPSYIQNVIIYDLENLIKYNDISILNSEELTEFWSTLTEILKQLSKKLLINHPINEDIKSFLIYIRNEKKFKTVENKNTIKLVIDDYLLDCLDNTKIVLDEIFVDDDILNVKGCINTHFNTDYLSIKLISKQCTDNENMVNHIEYDTKSIKYLDIDWMNECDFHIKVELKEKHTQHYFILDYDDYICKVSVRPEIEYVQTSPLYNNLSYINEEANCLIYKENNLLKTYPFTPPEDKFYLFSIIMAVYNSEAYLKEAIESIINQTLNFRRYVQLILVDDGSSDSSSEIINRYKRIYPNNIISISKKHEGVGSARNLGLAHATGRYVNFLDSDDYLSKNTLQLINGLFKKYQKNTDVIAIPMKYFDREDTQYDLNYKFKGNRVLYVDKHPNYPQISISSTFIKRNVIGDLSFDTDLVTSEDTLFINKIILKTSRYLTTDKATYYYRKRSNQNSIKDNAPQSKEYYTNRLRKFHVNLIDYCMDKFGEIPNYVQFLLAYDLRRLIEVDELEIFDNEEEINEFNELLEEVVGHITNDHAIMKNRNIRGHYRNYLMYLRNKDAYHIESSEDNLVLKQDNIRLDNFKGNKIGLDIIEIKHGHLTVAGYLNTCFDSDKISVKLLQEYYDNTSKIHETEFFYYPQKDRKTIKFLSHPWKYFHNFEFKIKLDELINSKLSFIVEYNDGIFHKKYSPHLGLRLPSGLSTSGIHMTKDGVTVYYQEDALHVIPYSYKHLLRLEASIVRKIFRDKKDGYWSVFFIRMLYMVLYPLMKNRKIWLFNDRPMLADDNAKHLFKYSIKKNDDVKKYYVLNGESKDYETMKSISKNTVKFGSLKHKLLFLYADKHISAFVNEEYRNPFYQPGGFDDRRSYSGLATTQRYFLQHGVTLGNVTRSLKKYNTNLSLIVCGSPLERDSFFQWDYNYDESIINVLGLPRYDNLTTDDSKKQIVFMPTWRANLKDKESLFNSEFYKSLNSFINNKNMHNFLKEKGYEFVFKPHPELLKYLEYMELNDNIKVSLEDSYQDLFRDSSILITDYSSVAFDFAYLKKPVIYYQPNDDYPYEKGYFIFEEMGFGDVILKEDETIDKIENYILTGCQMEDKYKDRVNNFFKYTDKNNCKRVYEWIYND